MNISAPAQDSSLSSKPSLLHLQAGIIGGLMATIFAISHATLVVGAAAPDSLAIVIGMALVGTAKLNLFATFFGQVRGGIHMSQDVPSAAMGAVLLVIVADRTAGHADLGLPEIVALIVTASLFLAICLFTFGAFRMSAIMRYAPRPVIAGFLAGTGYFILIGGLGICLAAEVTLRSLPELFSGQAFYKLLVALAVACALQIGLRVLPPSIMIGIVMFGAIACFHLLSALFGVSTQGWFVTLPEGGSSWPPIPISEILSVDPGFLLGQVVPLLGMVVLSTLALLMMSSAVETVTREDIDLDRELKSTGLANFVSAVLGGMPGYIGAASTLSALKVTSAHRVISLVAACLAFSVFFFGNTILGLLPMPVFAGFLIWVGIAFLRDWLWAEIRNTTRAEAAVTLAIFTVIVVFGLFEGTVFGLLAAGGLFVVNYSRMHPVRSTMYGDAYLGASELNPKDAQRLQENGQTIAMLKLQGFVFFGTAHRLQGHIKELITHGGVRYLVVDFTSVTGIDATAIATFWRIIADLQARDARATFSAVSPQIQSVFERAGVPLGKGGRIALAPNLDTALEGYQGQLLQELTDGNAPDEAQTVQDTLTQILRSQALSERLSGYLERMEVAACEVIIQEGDADQDIFFLESGQMEVFVGSGANRKRIRVLGAGAVIGEISFYNGGTRTSTVEASSDAVVWRFSAAAAQDLMEKDPRLASQFHAGIAALLAQRVVANTRLIHMLQT